MSHTETTIDTYNRHSEATARLLAELHHGLYLQPLLGFRDLLSQGATVLDVGCGPGDIDALLLAGDPTLKIAGVDLSEELLKVARDQAPTAAYWCGDIRDLPLAPQAYDAVIASFCLPHLKDAEAVKLIGDVSLMLRPGGLLYLSTMQGEGARYETASFSHGDLLFYNFYSEACLRRMLATNHLAVVDLLKQDYPEPDGSVTVDIFIYAKKG